MTRPEVSIIIPCFNYGKYLPYSLESVLSQTFSYWECLIIDDGSTDTTSKVAYEFQSKDNRIRCFRQNNQGPSVARNLGLKESKGQFIQFLDADDAIECEKIASQVAFLKKHPNIDLVYGNVLFFRDKGKLVEDEIHSSKIFLKNIPKFENEDSFFKALIQRNFIVTHAPLLRAEIIDSIGYFDESLKNYEDWDFWVRCALGKKRFFYFECPSSKALVRVHPKSLSRHKENRLDKISGEIQIRLKLSNQQLSPELFTWNLNRLQDLNLKKTVLKSLQDRIVLNPYTLFSLIKDNRNRGKAVFLITTSLLPASIVNIGKTMINSLSKEYFGNFIVKIYRLKNLNNIFRRYFILKPSDSFGNRAEEIYFALLKCRQEKKRLILIKLKFNLFYKFKFRKGNSEVLKVKHPIIFQNPFVEFFNYFFSFNLSILRIFSFFLWKLSNLIGYKINHIFIREGGGDFLINRNAIWKKRISWENEFEVKLNVSYGPRKSLYIDFPVLEGQKYVCLHVRSGGFLDDFNSGRFRNANIENYFSAIQALTDLGYVIVRLGDPSMPKVKLDGVIDYANHPKRSEKNDILLIEHCEFYIGSQSGPIDTAGLFEKKILTINCTSLAHCIWYRKGSLFIPRKPLIDGKILTLEEQIMHNLFEANGTGHMDKKVSYIENSPNEILEAVHEFVNFSEINSFQKFFNSVLEKQLLEYFQNKFYFSLDPTKDSVEKNRWISRIVNPKGSICSKYLEQNWRGIPL